MTVGIYKITCTANNKIYVGQSVNIEKRFNKHMHEPPKLMREDFEEHGRIAFKLDILEECNENQLNKLEEYYIEELKPEYNIAPGGGRVSESSRQLMRESHLGKQTRNKPIRCVENGKRYENIKTAGLELGIYRQNISKVLQGKLKTAGGYHFIYDYEEGPRPIPPHKSCKPIICVELDRKFYSVKETSLELGIARQSISKVLCGKIKTAGGYHFIYDYEEGPRPILPHKSGKPVRCVETGDIFESIHATEKFAGVCYTGISACLNGKQKTAGGYHWEYI